MANQTIDKRANRHDDAICDYMLSERGCVKGSNCDFKHPTAPDGTVTNRVCEYWGTGRGCLKSNECKFLHPIRYAPTGAPATKVCDFYLTAQGCVKSNSCDYLHPKAVPALFNLSGSGRGLDSLGIKRIGGVGSVNTRNGGKREGNRSTPSVVPASNGAKECKYWKSEEGCRRGSDCLFKHESVPSNDSSSTSSSSNPSNDHRKPNVLRGGVGSRGSSIVPSIHKIPRQCQYYSSKEGCKKGDLCDFVHMHNRPCAFYKSGECKKGNACDFIHSDEPSPTH